MEQNTGLVVEEIGRDRCTQGRCVYGKCLDRFVLESLEGLPISLDVLSFVSPRHHQKLQCICKEGYAGKFKYFFYKILGCFFSFKGIIVRGR